MFSELLADTGIRILGDLPPNGTKFWAERVWERSEAEREPNLAQHYIEEKRDLLRLIETYAADATELIEFCCGSGEFLQHALDLTKVEKLTGIDVCGPALARAEATVRHSGLRLIEGDFWDDSLGLGTADLVMCIDSLQHLGNTRAVLERMRSFVQPGGVFLGNVWTRDNYHELERKRYGNRKHLARTASFFGTAVLIRLSGGRLRSDSYRTRLASMSELDTCLRETFPVVYEVNHHRYHTSFVCRC